MERKTVLDRALLNKALEREIERGSMSDQQLVADLCVLIGGNCNPQLTIDQAISAALRVADKLPYVCAAGQERVLA
jgi:hypothetical protein